MTRQARSNGMSVLEADQMLAGRFSRRNLLGYGTAVAVALPTLNSRGTASAATTLRSEPRIVVVGAGIAGLGCAYRLWTKYGRHVDVYEYNSTPGGRIRTLRNYFADGQLIEGSTRSSSIPSTPPPLPLPRASDLLWTTRTPTRRVLTQPRATQLLRTTLVTSGPQSGLA